MLLAIRDYIQARQEVTLHELASHFQVPNSVMLDRVNHWVRKGVVLQKNSPNDCQSGCKSSCAGCTQFDQTAYIIYVWVDKT